LTGHAARIGEEYECMKGFDEKYRSKYTTINNYVTWEDNIKIDLTERG
jgi:hypothetical protein